MKYKFTGKHNKKLVQGQLEIDLAKYVSIWDKTNRVMNEMMDELPISAPAYIRKQLQDQFPNLQLTKVQFRHLQNSINNDAEIFFRLKNKFTKVVDSPCFM